MKNLHDLTPSEMLDELYELGREQEEAYKRGELYLFVNTEIWSGYWSIKERSKISRRVGRFLKSPLIYSLGLHVEWIKGLVEYVEDEDLLEMRSGEEIDRILPKTKG